MIGLSRPQSVRLAAVLTVLLTGYSTVNAAAAAQQSASTPASSPVAAQVPSAAAVVEVAPGVYFAQGAVGEPDPANRGRIGNAGFIVGPDGVIVVDTGTSYQQGAALLDAIRRVTPLPVRLAIITHARQEFLFGAAAFQQQGIPVAMQRSAADLMRSRCEQCLANLQHLLGDREMQGSKVIKPDIEFEHSYTLGVAGRTVDVLYFGHSSGPGAVAVLDDMSGVLFAGGLADQHRVPDVQDADLEGWLQALQQLQVLPIATVMPGHGGAASPAVLSEASQYLSQLRTRVLKLLDTGAALSDVPDAAMLPAYAGWDQYQTIHRRNASVLFLRYERGRLFDEPLGKH